METLKKKHYLNPADLLYTCITWHTCNLDKILALGISEDIKQYCLVYFCK